MTPGAHVAAAIEVLDVVLGGAPAEKTLTNWARKNRFAGSGDRAAIRDLVYDALRQKRSLAWLGGKADGRGLMIGHCHATGREPGELFTGLGHAPSTMTAEEKVDPPALQDAPGPVRLDCQDWLFEAFQASLGDVCEPILISLQTRAPVFLRVNTTRSSVAEARALLAKDDIDAEPHTLVATALKVVKNPRRVRQSRAFLDGHVDLQDAASQAVVERLLPHVKGRRVLDFCAGGGGKSLALAAGGAGAVHAHDANPARMADLPERARRGGHSIRIEPRPEGPYDVVLCDAPCSGSGAWRRQPEAKWRLSPEGLQDLMTTQDAILQRACQLVDPKGLLAYVTCSLLDEENDQRITAFLDRHEGWERLEKLAFTPLMGGDGFHLSILQRKTGV